MSVAVVPPSTLNPRSPDYHASVLPTEPPRLVVCSPFSFSSSFPSPYFPPYVGLLLRVSLFPSRQLSFPLTQSFYVAPENRTTVLSVTSLIELGQQESIHRSSQIQAEVGGMRSILNALSYTSNIDIG